MSGATTDGWPYATPDDHPVAWPAMSQQLAQKLDGIVEKVAYGHVTTGAAPLAVAFPVGKFTGLPVVVASLMDRGASSVGSARVVEVHDVTAAGFTVSYVTPGVGFFAANIAWVAVGP